MRGCSERESEIAREIGREKIEREDVRERERDRVLILRKSGINEREWE